MHRSAARLIGTAPRPCHRALPPRPATAPLPPRPCHLAVGSPQAACQGKPSYSPPPPIPLPWSGQGAHAEGRVHEHQYVYYSLPVPAKLNESDLASPAC